MVDGQRLFERFDGRPQFGEPLVLAPATGPSGEAFDVVERVEHPLVVTVDRRDRVVDRSHLGVPDHGVRGVHTVLPMVAHRSGFGKRDAKCSEVPWFRLPRGATGRTRTAPTPSGSGVLRR